MEPQGKSLDQVSLCTEYLGVQLIVTCSFSLASFIQPLQGRCKQAQLLPELAANLGVVHCIFARQACSVCELWSPRDFHTNFKGK